MQTIVLSISAPSTPGVVSKCQNSFFFLKVAMLHIKLKGYETYNSNQATIFPLHTQSLKVKTFISSSESSHIAYQMNRTVGHVYIMGIYTIGMRGSRKFCQRGSIFDNGFFISFFFLFFLEGRDDPNKYHYKRTLTGLPAKCHLNGVSLACRLWPKNECWYGSL